MVRGYPIWVTFFCILAKLHIPDLRPFYRYYMGEIPEYETSDHR